MTVTTAERRRDTRTAAAFAVTVCDRRRRLLARGKTANISEAGVFIVVHPSGKPFDPPPKQVLVELTLPALTGNSKRPTTRAVVYLCRVVHTIQLGQMVGLGLQFIEKKMR